MSIRESLSVATKPRDRSRVNQRENVRQQYTIKGVDTDTLQMVRNAADHEGMKISSWISKRMKEAAERSLTAQSGKIEEAGSGRNFISTDAQADQLAEFMESVEGRLRDVERDLHQLMRVQRSLMAQLMERDLDR
jgi:hypothetical protein